MKTIPEAKAAILDEWLSLEAIKAVITSPAGTYHDSATGRFTHSANKGGAGRAASSSKGNIVNQYGTAFTKMVRQARALIQEHDLSSGMVVYDLDSTLHTIDTDTWLNSSLNRKAKKVATVYSRRIEDAAGKIIPPETLNGQ
ncbi:MAG: hypothetical protein KJ077_10470 [Anaerolineae bacterium]|nr:hypothetical protein [Anaerolineae bacterium]